MMGLKNKLYFSTALSLLAVVFSIFLPFTSSLLQQSPITNPDRVDAVASFGTCYDEDVSGYVCTNVRHAEENGIWNIPALNNDPEFPGLVFTQTPSINPGGLRYESQHIEGFDEIIIEDACQPNDALWRAANPGGGTRATQNITLTGGELNLDAQFICEEGTTDDLGFSINLVIELEEPTEEYVSLEDIIIRIDDADGNEIDTWGSYIIAIEVGSTSGFIDIVTLNDALVNGEDYTICFVGATREFCETVSKTENVQSFTLTVETLGDLIEIGGERAIDAAEIERSCSGFALIGWLLCPLIQGLFQFIQFLYANVILTSLIIEPLAENTTDASTEAIFSIWNSFRIIANILLFIVFILAIFGSSLAGFQVFSAYETKKIIPRLVVGTVAIQLSYYIVGFAVDIFNVIGASVRGLILAPVDGLQSIDFDFGSVGELVGILLGGAAIWVARFSVGAAGFLYAIPLILVPIVLALLVTMVVLLFRKMVIFLLIVLALVAFVFGIMPGTERWLKQWWDLLWKALFMFPLIIGFIAGGELVAKILVAGDESSATNQIMGMIALFTPYFLIPSTFKLAGNAVAAIGGGISNMGGGLKEKILGQSHDPGSIRGRARSERVTNRKERTDAFMRRHSGNMASGLRSKNGKVGIAEALSSGLKSKTRRRSVGLPGGKTAAYDGRSVGFGINADGTAKKRKDGTDKRGIGMNLSGAIGGLVASAGVRYAGMTPQSNFGGRVNDSIQWAFDQAEVDDAILLAGFGYDYNPNKGPRLVGELDDDGNVIEPLNLDYYKALYKPHEGDMTKTIGVLAALMSTAGNQDVIERHREQLLKMDKYSDDEKELIWFNAAYAMNGLHPNLQNVDVHGGKIKAGSVAEMLRKDVGRNDSYKRYTFHQPYWHEQEEAYELIKDGSVAKAHTSAPHIEDEAKVDIDRTRSEVQKDLLQSVRSQSRTYLRAAAEMSSEDQATQQYHDWIQAGRPAMANPPKATDAYRRWFNTPPADRSAKPPVRRGTAEDVFNYMAETKAKATNFGMLDDAGNVIDQHDKMLSKVVDNDGSENFRNTAQVTEAYVGMLKYFRETEYFDKSHGDFGKTHTGTSTTGPGSTI